MEAPAHIPPMVARETRNPTRSFASGCDTAEGANTQASLPHRPLDRPSTIQRKRRVNDSRKGEDETKEKKREEEDEGE